MKIGKYEAIWLRDTLFGVDGGAMFHMVPKALWEKRVIPDEKNRVFVGLNCLLLRGEGQTILYDAGIGNKLSDKQKNIYGLNPNQTLLKALSDVGVKPADINVVIPSHLHFDHAGWLTVRDSENRLSPTFPRARHIVQEAEWKAAHETTELTAGSYMRDDFDILAERGLLELVRGDYTVSSSVTAILTGAHSPGHQILKVESEETTLICPCEMIPSAWHLRPAWVTSYDLEPAKVLEVKKSLMRDAAARNWLVFLSHDPTSAFGRLKPLSGKEYAWLPCS